MLTEEATEQVECDSASCSSKRDACDLQGVKGGEMVCELCIADDYVACDDCKWQVLAHCTTTVNSEGTVCEECLRAGPYFECASCVEWCGGTYVYTYYSTLDGDEICEGCRDNGYSYCEDCDGYYADEDSEDHRHTGCACEAPAQVFRVRNGDTFLPNDNRVQVTLPAGVISDEGIGAIARAIRTFAHSVEDYTTRNKLYSLSYDAGVIGEKWQTKQGNYTKRLSRHAHKVHGVKVTPDLLTQVGNLARDHSTAVDFQVEVTRNLNLPAEDFAHEESCWWGGYSDSRCALKHNGGYGIRTFREHEGYDGHKWTEVTGRAWVMPVREVEKLMPPAEVWDESFLNLLPTEGPARLVKEMVPTFDTENADAYIVFNGYGDLFGYAPARLVAHMAGMTYRKVGFYCPDMYVNGGSGYLVAPEEIAARYEDGSVRLSVDAHSDLIHTEQSASVAVPA